jgi:hypothetical protein
MKYDEVQKSLMNCLKSNSISTSLMQFSKAMVLVYPIYLILCEFEFLNILTKYIAMFTVVMYLGYVIGLIISFAKNDMLSIGIAFGLVALSFFIGLIVRTFTLAAAILGITGRHYILSSLVASTVLYSVRAVLSLAAYGGLSAFSIYKAVTSRK